MSKGWIMKNVMKDLFTISGRCSLRKYWLYELTGTVIQIIYFLAACGVVIYRGEKWQTIPEIEAMGEYMITTIFICMDMLICSFLLTFILHLLSIGISVRRCHDIGWKGAWVILKFIPVVGEITFFFMMWRRGTAGINAYGTPDERAGENSRAWAWMNLGSRFFLLFTFLLFIYYALVQFWATAYTVFSWGITMVFVEYYTQVLGV
jgi:uncharacterized membrane protein YhaH (DUF805 family)